MFAVYDFQAARVAQMIVNSLAVLGGFFAGYALTALLANTLDRAVFRRRSPAIVHRGSRLLGGLALAILVTIIVFGHGQGWNLFGGGADGTGDSNQDGTPQIINTVIEKPTPESSPAKSNASIRIVILGGTDVVAEKFYLIDDDATPHTLAEVKEIILKKKAVPPLTSVEISFAPKNVLPQEHPAVLLLENWVINVAGLKLIKGR